MAKIEISLQEYLQYQKEVKDTNRFPSWLRIVFYLVFLFCLIQVFYRGLYFLGILLVLWYGLSCLVRKKFTGNRFHAIHYHQNKFLSGEVNLTLSSWLLTICAGLSQLSFAASEIRLIREFGEFYHISNHSGFELYVPKRCLDEQEELILREFGHQAARKHERWWGY